MTPDNRPPLTAPNISQEISTISTTDTAKTCDACGQDNRENAKFCSQCGNKFEPRCTNCGVTVPVSARFCDHCGTALETLSTPPGTDRQVSGAPENAGEAGARSVEAADAENSDRLIISNPAERRQLTVMFCDMVNSSGISEQLDPEDLSNVFAAYRASCQKVVERFGGHIARYIGDGLLVYFGYPVSYEDSAYRAVCAALGIVDAVEILDREFSNLGIKLAVRIGINTGKVVVGDIGTGKERESMGVVGEVPNIAARLQASAYPGDVVIGDSTRRLIEGMFELEDLGHQAHKGISTPVHTFRIRNEIDAPERFESSSKGVLSGMIGRDAETGLLIERWKQVCDGDGQVLLLSGEAGIGKSRIIKQFRDHLKDERHWRFLYYCSTHHQSSPFYPVVAQIEHNLNFQTSDTNETKLDKLKQGLVSLKLSLDENLPVYAFLLGITVDNNQPAGNAQQLRQKSIRALIYFYRALAKRAPILMIVEDIHWLDPSTFELLDLWIEQLQSERCFLILTFRPEFQPPWRHHSHFTSLTLNRLSRKDSEAIVTEITGGRKLPAQVLDDIIAKTDGVPLFLEELTKMVMNSNLLENIDGEYALQHPLPSLAIPESLQDSLMARLDQLDLAKEVAQLSATLGRRFTHKLLAAASGLSESQLHTSILKLLDAELIYQRGIAPDCVYEFKHAMVQDIAYQTLLKSTRLRYHQRIAQLLEHQFPEEIENHPEILAHHYTEAHIADQAVIHWHRAGQKAISRSANLEAINHIGKALGVLESLPDDKQRAKLELELQITLAVPLTSVKGYAAPEVQQTYTKARELCLKIGETPQMFPALYGMWRFYLMTADYTTAEELSSQLIDIATETGNLAFCAAAPRSMGATSFYQGNLSRARSYLEQVISLQESDEYREKALLFDVVDVEVVSHGYYAWTLWLQGYPDQAQRHSEIAIELADELDHQFSIALANCFAAWTYQFCENKSRTAELAKSALTLSRKYSFQFWVGWAKILRAWASPEDDLQQPRDEEMEIGLKEWHTTGSELGHTYFLTLLAQAKAADGDINESLTILKRAQKFADQHEEKFWQAEIYRSKGEVLMLMPDCHDKDAQFCFERAMEIAIQQHNKSLQLRAAMSLARLFSSYNDTGKVEKAYATLDSVYHSFTEGFDTSDLRQARSLLEHGPARPLSHSSAV